MVRAQPRKKQWPNVKQQHTPTASTKPPAADHAGGTKMSGGDRNKEDPQMRTESYPLPESSTTTASNPQDSARFKRNYVWAALIGRRVTCTTTEGVRINGILSSHGSSGALPDFWDSDNEAADASKQPESGPTSEARVYVRGYLSSETVGDANDPQFAFYQSSCNGPLYLWLRGAHRVATGLTRSSRVFDWLAIPWADVSALQSSGGVPDSIEVEEKLVSMYSGGAGIFQTDAEIARLKTGGGGERRLQRWSGSVNPSGEAGSKGDTLDWPLDESRIAEGASSNWDQFAYNERMFGVRSTYVDGMYSTELNEREIPEEFRKRAERIAEEMVVQGRNPKSGWRLHDDEAGDCDDEEAKFSAVAGTGAYAQRSSRSVYGSSQGSIGGAQGSTSGMGPRGSNSNFKQLSGKASSSQGGVVSGVPPRLPPLATVDQTSESKRHPSLSGNENRSTSDKKGTGLQRTQIVTRPPTDVGTGTNAQSSTPQQSSGQDAGAGTTGNDSERRLFKDNINALNLEPAKKSKAVLPLIQHHHLPTRVPHVGYPAAAAYQKFLNQNSANLTTGVDISSIKLKKKEEFLAAARDIEKKMAKKGWISSQQQSPARATTTQPIKTVLSSKLSAIPPHPSRTGTQKAGILPPQPPSTATAGANTSSSGSVAPPSGLPTRVGAPPMPLPPPATTVGANPAAPPPPEATGKQLSFQFNPNASSFTPKGAQSSEGDMKAPSSDRLPRQPIRTGMDVPVNAAPGTVNTTVPTHHFELLQANPALPPSQTEGIRNAPMAFGLFQRFKAEAYQAGCPEYGGIAPSQTSPDWPNKLPFSYVDVLDYSVKPSAAAAAMAAPFAMPPPPPYLHPPFSLAATTQAAAAAGMPMAMHASPGPQFMPPPAAAGWNQAIAAAAAARPADAGAMYQQTPLGYPRHWQLYYYMNPSGLPRETMMGSWGAAAQPPTGPPPDPNIYSQQAASSS